MSLHPHIIAPVPDETARIAHAAFPKGHPYLTFRDALGTILQDEDFAALFPAWGPPGLPPWRLALVTIMQFRENLADRQAAEAVRARIDWKYLLGLDLTDPGFDFSALSDLLPMAKARGIPPLGRTPNALPAPQAPAYLPMAKARGITQDLVMGTKRSCTTSHQRPSQSTRQSLVTLEVIPYRNSSSNVGRKIPTGVTVASG